MECPKCNVRMEIKAVIETVIMPDQALVSEVIGRCENCNIDATWKVAADSDFGMAIVMDYKQYHLG